MTVPEPAASEVPGTPQLPVAAGPDAGPFEIGFTAADLPALRGAGRGRAREAGLSGVPLDDLVVAVHELATNAVRHGGGRGRLDLRRDGDTLICDVTDRGPGFGEVPVPSGPPPAEVPGGRGLWLARLLTDTLLLSDGPDGVTVSVTMCL